MVVTKWGESRWDSDVGVANVWVPGEGGVVGAGVVGEIGERRGGEGGENGLEGGEGRAATSTL